MKVEEAWTKWCPFARVSYSDNSGYMGNRFFGEENPEEARCLGPGCMMWQWETKHVVSGNEIAEVLDDSAGYCGLSHPIGRR